MTRLIWRPVRAGLVLVALLLPGAHCSTPSDTPFLVVTLRNADPLHNPIYLCSVGFDEDSCRLSGTFDGAKLEFGETRVIELIYKSGKLEDTFIAHNREANGSWNLQVLASCRTDRTLDALKADHLETVWFGAGGGIECLGWFNQS